MGTGGCALSAAGDALVAPAVTRRLLAAYAGRRPPDREQRQLIARLTEREAEVLRALAEGLDAVLDWERDTQSALFLSADHAEGREAFLAKRPAVFKGD